MLKVIIAEDEMLVRIGLKHSIDWKALGMEVVADVDNGQSAYQKFLEERPQIMITDLRMPKMGGVELIQKIREVDQECLIIVISCVEDFEVLRGMIAYNIFDYLSKALMSMQEMNSVLEKARNTLMSTNKNRQVVEEDDVEDTLEQTLVAYLVDENRDIDQFLQCTAHMEVPYLALMVHKKFVHEYRDSKQRTIRNNTLRDLFKNSLMDVKGQVYTLNDERDMIFIQEKGMKSKEELEKDLLHIISTSKELLKVELKVIISYLPHGWEQLREKYQESKALTKKFYFLETPIIWEDQVIQAVDYIRELLQSIQIENLAWALTNSQKESYNQIIKEMIQHCSNENHTNYKQFIQDKIICLANLINDTTKVSTTEEIIQLQREIIHTGTLVDTIRVYRSFVEQVKEKVKEQRPKKEEIVKALQYIEAHYNKEIGLRSVANYVNLSPNYFSTLFKKEMNQSLVDYIIDLKIEKAKELLKTNMLFYQIAEEVGFSEETYFSKMFKLKTGVSPRAWKLNL